MREPRRVTRDMAIDAGHPEWEGMALPEREPEPDWAELEAEQHEGPHDAGYEQFVADSMEHPS